VTAGENPLRAELMRRFRTVETRVVIPGGHVDLLHPADPESLIDEADFDRDERLPYWADVWPSAVVLARHLAVLGDPARTMLELGCGAGLVATVAAMAGFDVTVSDYYADAMQFTRANVLQHAAVDPPALLLDWRALPDALARYDVVVASDVLYERPYGELVAEAIARTLADGGCAYLTDPGRVGVAAFLAAAAGCGLHVRTLDRIPYDAGGAARQTIDLYEVRWQ